MWGLVLLGCFIAGALATIVALRVRSRRRLVGFKDLLDSGRITWGGQVRWKLGRAWGASGSISLSRDGTMSWAPDRSSIQRGSKPRSWQPQELNIILEKTGRDITGIRFSQYRLDVPDGGGRFAMFHEVGTRPHNR